MKKYIDMVKGIADLRRQQLDSAVESLESAAQELSKYRHYPATAATMLYLAMAYARTERHEKARQTVRAADNVIDLLPGPHDDDFPSWNDWMIVQIVRREAAAVVGREHDEHAESLP